MKAIKYLFMSALLMGFSTAANAQDGSKADVAAFKEIINSKPADMDKQLSAYYKKNKKNAENLVAFGRAFYDAEDYKNATVYADYALKANKKFAPAYILQGDIAAVGEEDGGKAAVAYETAILYDEKNVDAYRKYANVYRKVDPTGAVEKLEQLRNIDPSYPVDALIGHINYISLRYGKAIEAYEKAPLQSLSRMDYIEFAMANYHAKQYNKALEVAKAGLQKDPLNATLNRIALMNANEVKKYGEALKYAENMFNKIDKDSVKLNDIDYLNYGKALSGSEQYEAAIEKFKAALTMDAEDKSQHASLYKATSDAYKGMKDFPNAIDYYKQYLKADEDADATEYASLGMLMMQYARSLEGDAQVEAYKQADQHFADLVTKFPDSEEFALFQRGRINNSIDPDMSQGLAKPHFERLASLISARENIDDTDRSRIEGAYRYLMSYYNSQKDYVNALGYAQKLQQLKPEDEGIQKLVEMLTKAASK